MSTAARERIDDDLWSAVGDPTRRRILDLLLVAGDGPINAGGSATIHSRIASIVIGRVRSSSFARPARTVPRPKEMTFIAPRRLGSSASASL